MCTHTVASCLETPVAAPLPRTFNTSGSTPVRTLVLAAHESVRIVDASGRALCDILSGPEGPIVQLAASDTAIDVAGKLRIHADAIEMIARDGEMKMLAKDDVVLRGEKIRLN